MAFAGGPHVGRTEDISSQSCRFYHLVLLELKAVIDRRNRHRDRDGDREDRGGKGRKIEITVSVGLMLPLFHRAEPVQKLALGVGKYRENRL